MTKFYWILAVVAVAGIAAVGYSVGSGTMGKAATEPVEVEGLDQMETLVSMAQGITKGDPDAPITIAEFSDYQCPGCGAFVLTVKPQIELNYIQNGKAKFVYYDFPLISIHPYSFLAARAGRCANDQGKFWEFQNIIYRNQSTWVTKTSVEGDFVDYAVQAGAEKKTFEACLKSDAHADVVSANLRLAEELGIEGTPTVMISMGRGMARRLMSFDYASIRDAIETLVAESRAASGAQTDTTTAPGS
ncbi:MAG TPA: thioredoxin domain-containing protein [Longimicrobiales bacterium]|nr:thioredoxin domain-containing protein [Longimicrobiales bacterium]